MSTPIPDHKAIEGFFSKARASHSGSRAIGNRTLSSLCIVLSLLTLIPLFSIVFLVLQKGLPLLSPAIFTELPPAAGMKGGGFGNAIIGTIVMVAIGLGISGPIGILAAVYTNEYNPHGKLSDATRFVAKLLTGIPSIICGVFAYAVIVIATGGFSAWAGGVALSILMLPTIFLTAEQALISVPYSYREAAYGLGSTNFQAIWRIILPDAFPAIMTGIMLAVARAAGETAPLIFTALFSNFWAKSLMEPTASLSVLIYNFSTLPFPHQVEMAWTASLLLVIFVTIANVSAQLVFRKKF